MFKIFQDLKEKRMRTEGQKEKEMGGVQERKDGALPTLGSLETDPVAWEEGGLGRQVASGVQGRAEHQFSVGIGGGRLLRKPGRWC